MTTRAEASIDNALTQIEGKVRHSLANVRSETENKVKSLRQSIGARPFRSMAVAFAAGLALARLLQRLH
jgi:ElaB/YqjD/DUF883 family membrane-anchored ribosome-binding protein